MQPSPLAASSTDETSDANATVVAFLQHQLLLRLEICRLENLINEAYAIIEIQHALVAEKGASSAQTLPGLESAARDLIHRSDKAHLVARAKPASSQETGSEAKQTALEALPNLATQIGTLRAATEEFMNSRVMALPISCFVESAPPLDKHSQALKSLITEIQDKVGGTPQSLELKPLITSVQGRRDYENILTLSFPGLMSYIEMLTEHWGTVRETRPSSSIKSNPALLKEFEATKTDFYSYLFQMKHIALCCRTGIAAPIAQAALLQVDARGLNIAAKFAEFGFPGFQAKTIANTNPPALADPNAKAAATFYTAQPPAPVITAAPPPPPAQLSAPTALDPASLKAQAEFARNYRATLFEQQQMEILQEMERQSARQAKATSAQRPPSGTKEVETKKDKSTSSLPQPQLITGAFPPAVKRIGSGSSATTEVVVPPPPAVASAQESARLAKANLRSSRLAKAKLKLLEFRRSIIAYALQDNLTRPKDEQAIPQKTILLTLDQKDSPLEPPKQVKVPLMLADIFEILERGLLPENQNSPEQSSTTLKRIMNTVYSTITMTQVKAVGVANSQETPKPRVVGTPRPSSDPCSIRLTMPLLSIYQLLEAAPAPAPISASKKSAVPVPVPQAMLRTTEAELATTSVAQVTTVVRPSLATNPSRLLAPPKGNPAEQQRKVAVSDTLPAAAVVPPPGPPPPKLQGSDSMQGATRSPAQ